MGDCEKLVAGSIVLATGLIGAAAEAAVVYLDQFWVTKNGNTFFLDGFGDGNPPPSAPNFPNGTSADYLTFGNFVAGSESGGLLRLDSANGGLTQNALEQARRTLRATLDSNADSSNLVNGLKIDDTLLMEGYFNLTSLTGPLINGYGIRFSDRTTAGVHQVAEFDVRFNPATGKVELRYIMQDFDLNQITVAGLTDLTPPAGADQVVLAISRPNTGFDGVNYTNKNFYAEFAYLNGGSLVGFGSFNTPIALFNGEDFVRAEFIAFEETAVPEPGTLALIGLGLSAFVVARRRR